MFAGAVVVVLVLIGTAALAGASVGAPDRTIAGPVIAAGNGWVTVQTAGRRTGTINALTEAADKLTQEDYP